MEIGLIAYLSREVRRHFCHLFDILNAFLLEEQHRRDLSNCAIAMTGHIETTTCPFFFTGNPTIQLGVKPEASTPNQSFSTKKLTNKEFKKPNFSFQVHTVKWPFLIHALCRAPEVERKHFVNEHGEAWESFCSSATSKLLLNIPVHIF
jgi:hypothetical protein